MLFYGCEDVNNQYRRRSLATGVKLASEWVIWLYKDPAPYSEDVATPRRVADTRLLRIQSRQNL